MQIKLLGKRVAVEKLKKINKNQTPGFLVMPESEEYLGIIRYVGDETNKFEVGQKVYFSTRFQESRIGGTAVCIMDETEVYAIVTE